MGKAKNPKKQSSSHNSRHSIKKVTPHAEADGVKHNIFGKQKDPTVENADDVTDSSSSKELPSATTINYQPASQVATSSTNDVTVLKKEFDQLEKKIEQKIKLSIDAKFDDLKSWIKKNIIDKNEKNTNGTSDSDTEEFESGSEIIVRKSNRTATELRCLLNEKLPVDTIDDIERLEKKLEDKKHFIYFVQFLRAIRIDQYGGKSLDQVITGRLLHHDVVWERVGTLGRQYAISNKTAFNTAFRCSFPLLWGKLADPDGKKLKMFIGKRHELMRSTYKRHHKATVAAEHQSKCSKVAKNKGGDDENDTDGDGDDEKTPDE